MFDVAVIGAGIIGTTIVRELSRYDCSTVLIEKESDVANGTTKANSAIVHAGYDPAPGSLKAELNSRGNPMFDRLCYEMGVPFKNIGSLVVAMNDGEMEHLKELLRKGQENNVPGLKILTPEELKQKEPSIKEAAGALYAPTAGIVDPYGLAIALAENSAENGVEIKLNTPVTSIEKVGDGYSIFCGGRELKAKYVVNAAGLHADSLQSMAGSSAFTIRPNRGQYWLLDKSAGSVVNHVVFQCPGPHGKGVVVLPTVHGNLLVGPNAEEVDGKEEIQTTRQGLEFVRKQAEMVVEHIPFGQVITSFSGLRARTDYGDFIIEESREAKGFVNAAGIDSPGLAASPAIACRVVEILQEINGPFKLKKDFNPRRQPITAFIDRPEKEKEQLLNRDPRYGRVICRCETITEGEIVEAVHRKPGARTVDGLKKRVRVGAGRCQGGFCTPRVMKIIARELNLDIGEVTKDGGDSRIVTSPTPKGTGDPGAGRDFSLHESAGETNEKVTGKAHHNYDLVVIGGGPAGMAAAIEARKSGIESILVIERDREPGGILQQCIHNGFGLHLFQEELTGPEYAERFIKELFSSGIDLKPDTMVFRLNGDKSMQCMNSREGCFTLQAKAVILARGCRERTRGAVNIPGTRPAGVLTAGMAQRLVNMEGYLVGKKVVVFGSGDIGLIMARRMILEGAEVVAVLERKSYSEGLVRNQVQCLEDFDIPLYLRHTITEIKGKERVTGITVARVDDHKEPLPFTEFEMECDTVLFSRGLIPENELSRGGGVELSPVTGGPLVDDAMETSVRGIFACGNVVQVHDVVDWVTDESRRAGRGAARYILQDKEEKEASFCHIRAGHGIRQVVPQKLGKEIWEKEVDFFMRADGFYENVYIEAKDDDRVVKRVKKRHLAPGQMTVVKLNTDELSPGAFKYLTFEVKEKEQ